MNNPYITVITACYNSEKTITKTLESICAQTNRDFEYIIVDGKSSDKTIEIIEKYKKILNDQLIYVSERDQGIYDAMNKGIRMSSGKLISFIGSDDWYEKDCFQNVYDLGIDSEYQVLYGGMKFYNNSLEEKAVMYNHQFLSKQMICHGASFTTRKCFEKFGMFDLGYKSAADYDFMLRLYSSGEVEFTPIHKFLGNVLQGGTSSSRFARIEKTKVQYKYGYISRGGMIKETIKAYGAQILG